MVKIVSNLFEFLIKFFYVNIFYILIEVIEEMMLCFSEWVDFKID